MEIKNDILKRMSKDPNQDTKFSIEDKFKFSDMCSVISSKVKNELKSFLSTFSDLSITMNRDKKDASALISTFGVNVESLTCENVCINCVNYLVDKDCIYFSEDGYTFDDVHLNETFTENLTTALDDEDQIDLLQNLNILPSVEGSF